MLSKEWIEECWSKLDKKLSKTAVSSYDKIPYTTVNGVHDDKSAKDAEGEGISWWTNGFWSALMVLMYAGTKKQQYLDTARHGMDIMDGALYKFDGLHHDVGFMWNISAGMDYRLTGDEKERNRFLIAVNHLMGRYNCCGGFLKAWNGKANDGIVIIDSMMNIPLLYRAAQELDDEHYAMAAVKHADKAMTYHVRPNGICNHINEYDPHTGEFIKSHKGQGYSENSAWTRGQSWGLYGFALSYRYTKKKEYLETAERIADCFITNIKKSDWLPLCDFMQPETPLLYDSTAGACASCGLLELAELVPEKSDFYNDAACRIIKAMEEKFCDWSEEEDSILQYGTEAYGWGHHMPIIYGDYFFAEAIYRLKGFDSSILW